MFRCGVDMDGLDAFWLGECVRVLEVKMNYFFYTAYICVVLPTV